MKYARPWLLVAFLAAPVLVHAAVLRAQGIDRRALVSRHAIELREADPLSPLSIGNGQFCFTADVTGLQSFEPEYAKGMPLGTMAGWAWHSFPNPDGFRLEQTFVTVQARGRQATYPIVEQSAAAQWLRANPHRYSAGQIGVSIRRADGSPAVLSDLKEIRQRLDLWRGLLISEFQIEGQPVRVETVAHPRHDGIAARIESPLLAAGRLAPFIAFPYPSGAWGPGFNDWSKAEKHATTVAARAAGQVLLRRRLDTARYDCLVAHQDGSAIRQQGAHRWEIVPGSSARVLRFSVTFSANANAPNAIDNFDETRNAAAAYWPEFWRTGAAVDLSSSKDPRWRELERRIVLSQYLAAIQGQGKYPPQETGLTCNSWFGKLHLEMHWWHSMHWALWGRAGILEKQLEWYREVLPVMRATAQRQGYAGVRWGKMLGPDGQESPSRVGPLLIWQQPHPIYYAELVYRERKDKTTLEKYKDLVLETARFMASFAAWDEQRQQYELGPPLISAREFGGKDYARNKNPGFELAYWRWALKTANEWRRRAGLPAEPEWDRIAGHLAPLPLRDGIYIEQETPAVEDGGHPTMLASFGFLPRSAMVDPKAMERTLEHVMQTWPKDNMWGWDFPLAAMTAARVGRPDLAVDALLLDWPKNRYLPNRHNFQAARLPLYLPGNGGLLAAVAMMAAGWDGGPSRNAPGFPADGSWVVRSEGLRRMP